MATTFYVMRCAIMTIAMQEEEEEGEPEIPEGLQQNLTLALTTFRRMRKRARDSSAEEEDDSTKKKKKYDYERAHRCIQQDYLGPDPLCGPQFERIFRVTRTIVEKLIQVCGDNSPFFTHRNLCTGEIGICPEAKIMMALKTLGCGCSSSAFVDYFQMGLTSGKDCVKNFCKVVANSELKARHLRQLDKRSAKKVSNLHKHEFGVEGCIGCLDCMHVFWKNCPVAWQGQHEGKEGSPSIVLEGLSDCNACLWNLKFGFPGTLNDVNIWERSTLLKSFLDGTFTQHIDFDFIINNIAFKKLFLLVDGVYPELSRFVKTFSVPLTKTEKKFAKWQECMRKSAERAFGIAQRKFQMLCRPIEFWCEDNIEDIVTTCFILHNMMVEVRMERDQRENEKFYEMREADDDSEDEDDTEFVPRHQVDIDDDDERAPKPSFRMRMRQIRETWPQHCEERSAAMREAMAEHFDNVQSEWRDLYNATDHLLLREAIMKEVEEKKLI